MHIYNLQERVQVFIGHADLVLSSINNSHLCEGEVTLMGTSYIWNILSNNLTQMQRNHNQGSRWAPIFVNLGEPGSSPTLDTITDMANVYSTFFFQDHFSKLWVCASDKEWVCKVHVCAHMCTRACTQREAEPSNMEDKGLQSGVQVPSSLTAPPSSLTHVSVTQPPCSGVASGEM